MGERILIVEDEPIQQLNLEVALELAGHTVCGQQSTGEGALVAADVRRPDVVIMDVCLAGRIDGIETARRMRGLFPFRLIFVTALSDAATTARMRALAPAAILAKPLDSRMLLKAVA